MDVMQPYTYTHIFIRSIMKFALTMKFISLVEGKVQTDLSNKEKTVTVKGLNKNQHTTTKINKQQFFEINLTLTLQLKYITVYY